MVVAIAAGRAGAEPTQIVYAEMLGKGGLWGAGYEVQPTAWLAFGGVGSYYELGGDRYATLSPYAAAYPLRRGRHGWYIQLGPQLVHRSTPSPVPEWSGMSATAFDAELTTGYEHRSTRGVVARVGVMLEVGERVAPWLGASLGWAL
jgi:hypothetical protein